MPGERVNFRNGRGLKLAGRLEMPGQGEPRAYALFAHCFTCGKDVRAAVNIARALRMQGIAVLRFDFTGLGESEGEFADSNFSTSVDDLVCAANYLADHHEAPKILVGHSLGGTAVLEAAHSIESAVAVATIAAPADPADVLHLFADDRPTIESRGEAEVDLMGRTFLIRKQFLDDLAAQHTAQRVRELRRALLIFHSPVDRIVGIDNAATLFREAMHPKSFITLNQADHLLSRHEDSEYVGLLLAAWARKYLHEREDVMERPEVADGEVLAQLDGDGLRTDLFAGNHTLVADEPRRFGGTDAGPSPYGLLTASLGACTAMTLRMYAQRKSWPLESVDVRLRHQKVHADDCADCESGSGKVDTIERLITIKGPLDDKQRARLLEIADMCPVHRTLQSEVVVRSRLTEEKEAP
ncbi:MAG: alpha/beta fold hydrolase [Gammaproteobacteria bacterium]|jgi:putative redox protein